MIAFDSVRTRGLVLCGHPSEMLLQVGGIDSGVLMRIDEPQFCARARGRRGSTLTC